MNGNHYTAPQMCSVQENSGEVFCASNVDNMNYIDGDWESDLTF